MKFSIYFLLLIFISSCSSSAEKNTNLGEEEMQDADSTAVQQEIEIDTNSTATAPKILIVPCANGYEYNVRYGDVNISLEKYLALDERITIEPFPYRKMQGAGYHGVYDKKHCASILENTDADFLIMTRMSGGLVPMRLVEDSTASQNWGYSTRILNTKTMEQFDGIRGNGLESFETIDPDVKQKAETLIQLILTR